MPTPSFRRALVIANPVAGRGRARERAGELAAGLERAGVETELFFTAARGDAPRRLARLDGAVDLVVAVGGDGTLGEVLSGLSPELPVAVLPMGTANVLAGDLKLPRDVPGVLAMIAAGRETGLDTARVNGRLSFLVTGIGVDGAIVRDVEARRRGPIRRAFYVTSVLRTLARHRSPRLSVEVDGTPLDGTWAWVLISNIVGYGGFMRLSADRRLDDGLFEVFLFPRGSPWALVGYGLRGMLRHLPGGSCKMVRARRVRVQADEPVPFEVDGDYGGETPVEFEVAQERHRLIVP